MKALKIISFASLFFISAVVSHAEQQASPERLFARGNDYYEQGDYANAISEYEKVLASKKASAALYYNLAGAYFKDGNLGKAILNDERASYIMPRDADLNKNYKFAQAMVKGRIMPARNIWSWYPLRIYYKYFTVDELTWLSSGAFMALLLLFLAALVWHGTRGYTLTLAVMLAIVILCNTVIIWHKARDMKTAAITVAPRAEAYFGPFDTATKFFTLSEGDKVNVVNEKDDWYKVIRADGKVGWIHKNEAERI